jgi:hypothetical protein
MSSVVISGDTSGAITLSAPAVAGTNTITLPASTGTVALTAAPTFTGQATIPTINLTGGQITFPATQNPSSDANTLDDYEEGTWSPELRPASGGSYSWAIQAGRYVKIGKLVTLHGFVQFGTVGSAGSGQMYLQNFPFATLNSGDLSSNTSLSIGRSGSWSSTNPVCGAVTGTSGVTAAELYQRATSTSAVTDLPASAMATNAYVGFSITYTANA